MSTTEERAREWLRNQWPNHAASAEHETYAIWLAAFAKSEVEAERKRCAEIARKHAPMTQDWESTLEASVALKIAKAIEEKL